MSGIAASSRAPASAWSYAALAFALAAAVVWVLAGIVDDGLYVVTGALGIVGFATGVKGRHEARPIGARLWPAVVGIVLGGLLGGAVIAFTIGWGIYHVVT